MKPLFLALAIFSAVLFLGAGKASAVPTPVNINDPNSNQINTNIPGSADAETGGPIAILSNLYEFAFVFAGFLAFGAIVYGGLRYAMSAGSSSIKEEGRSWITNAFLGLALLMGAYLLLNIINPELTVLKFPVLTPFGTSTSVFGPGVDPNQLPPNADVWACKDAKGAFVGNSCYVQQRDCHEGCEISLDENGNEIKTGSTCVSAKVSECKAAGKNILGSPPGMIGTCPVRAVTAIASLGTTAAQLEAAARNHQSTAIFNSSDSKVQANLDKLKGAIGQLEVLLRTKNATLTVNSAFRSKGYQQHFAEISDRYHQFENNPAAVRNTDCKALYDGVVEEMDRIHGLSHTYVSQPTCNAPHVKGIAADMVIDGYSLNDINKLMDDNNIPLHWKALDGDRWHFELKDPPEPGACGQD